MVNIYLIINVLHRTDNISITILLRTNKIFIKNIYTIYFHNLLLNLYGQG